MSVSSSDLLAEQAAEIRINRLGYTVLGVLLRDPTSGYEVVKALEKFRPVNVSQVYPLLAEMEEKGLLYSEEIVQAGKPDKKVYHATPLAHAVVRDWIDAPTQEAVIRDDFMGKVYSFWTSDDASKRRLIHERINWLNLEIAYFAERLAQLHAQHGEAVEDPRKWPFSRDVLMRRRLALYHEEQLWCRRVLERLDRADTASGAEAPELGEKPQ